MWLYLPISVSSQERADSILPSDSLLQRLAASAMWRSSFRQSASWLRAWKTVPWIGRLCGVTYEPSRQDSIVAEWLAQFSVSPARICLSQESKRALKAEPEAGFSSMPCESFARLDASGSFLRTSRQCSLFPQDIPYSENLPKAGSMRNGFLYEQPTWERPTAESACSSWPTARAEDSECCGNHPGAVDSLGGAAKVWPTPDTINRVRDDETLAKCAEFRKRNANQNTVPLYLAEVAQQWPTPDANTSTYSNGHNGFMNIREAAATWTLDE
jgi:hypothetical protein